MVELPLGTVLEVYGDYFLSYVADKGYRNLLTMQGETLLEFLANIDGLHRHLQQSLVHLRPPQVWRAANICFESAPAIVLEFCLYICQTIDLNAYSRATRSMPSSMCVLSLRAVLVRGRSQRRRTHRRRLQCCL